MTRRQYATAALAVCLVGTAVAYAEPVTRVALVTTLTGPLASYGVDLRDGLWLGLQMAGAEKIDLVFADEPSGRTTGDPVIARLRAAEIDIVLGFDGSDAAAEAARRTGAVFLPLAQPDRNEADAVCRQHPRAIAWRSAGQTELLGVQVNDAGYSNVFVLAEDSEGGHGLFDRFREHYSGALAGELFLTPAEATFEAALAQVRASGADAVVELLPGPAAEEFRGRFTESGIGLPLMSLSALRREASYATQTAGPALLAGSTAGDFQARFAEQYGRPANVTSLRGKATAMRLVALVEAMDMPDAQALQAAWSEEADRHAGEPERPARPGPGAHPLLAARPNTARQAPPVCR